ncbi:MAG: hypothetical protein ACXABY_03825 [Candidatus Thorarchaeota archaeon]|jgi:hypothetical protein
MMGTYEERMRRSGLFGPWLEEDYKERVRKPAEAGMPKAQELAGEEIFPHTPKVGEEFELPKVVKDWWEKEKEKSAAKPKIPLNPLDWWEKEKGKFAAKPKMPLNPLDWFSSPQQKPWGYAEDEAVAGKGLAPPVGMPVDTLPPPSPEGGLASLDLTSQLADARRLMGEPTPRDDKYMQEYLELAKQNKGNELAALFFGMTDPRDKTWGAAIGRGGRTALATRQAQNDRYMKAIGQERIAQDKTMQRADDRRLKEAELALDIYSAQNRGTSDKLIREHLSKSLLAEEKAMLEEIQKINEDIALKPEEKDAKKKQLQLEFERKRALALDSLRTSVPLSGIFDVTK